MFKSMKKPTNVFREKMEDLIKKGENCIDVKK